MNSIKIIPFIFLIFPITLFGQIDGQWHSSFTVMGKAMLMDMRIETLGEEVKVFLSNPESDRPEKRVNRVEFQNNQLSYEWTEVYLTFDGTYHPQGDSISGKMNQSGISWDVTFHKEIQEKKVLVRPQEPVAPFSFIEQELSVRNGDVQLSGSLTIPQNCPVNAPIVILASGSGPQDRNCEIMGHKPFLVIADHLAKNGIMCLRFDDRGTGKSTGDFSKSTLFDFASDVRVWLDTIHLLYGKSHPIGLAGHSEGGMHVLTTAAGNKKVDFVIELASVGTSGKTTLVTQQYLIPLQEGKSEEYAKWNQSVFETGCNIVQEFDLKTATDTLGKFLASAYDNAPDEFDRSVGRFAYTVSMTRFFNSQWMREFLNWEAAPNLKKVKVPMLVLNGEKDVQVPAEVNQEGFKKSISKKSRKSSEIKIIPGTNHLFQTCSTCSVSEYSDLDETFFSGGTGIDE